MTARRGLGDLFNLATSATTSSVRVNLQNYTGVTFALIGATSGNVTVQEANAATGGTLQTMATLPTEYFTQNNGLWTRVTSTTYTAATGGLLAVYVAAVNLSSGFTYAAASHASGSFVYILHGAEVRRDPPTLKAVTA